MENNKCLEDLEHFFAVDLNIKRTLYSLAPNEQDFYDEDSMIDYTNRVYDALKYFEIEFLKMVKDFKMSTYLSNKISKLFKAYREVLLNQGYGFERLKNFYITCLSDMRKSFVDDVRKVCKGHTSMREFYFDDLVEDISTVNEMLHLYHTYIVNNEQIYGNLNKIAEKTNDLDGKIKLLGHDNEITRSIYEAFTSSFYCGDTDIIALNKNKKIILMIKDRGHATTIEIDEEVNDFKVSYFIPKVINAEMVNKLRGVNRVGEDASFDEETTGMFVVGKDELLPTLLEFISMIPIDKDYVSDKQVKL